MEQVLRNLEKCLKKRAISTVVCNEPNFNTQTHISPIEFLLDFSLENVPKKWPPVKLFFEQFE